MGAEQAGCAGSSAATEHASSNTCHAIPQLLCPRHLQGGEAPGAHKLVPLHQLRRPAAQRAQRALRPTALRQRLCIFTCKNTVTVFKVQLGPSSSWLERAVCLRLAGGVSRPSLPQAWLFSSAPPNQPQIVVHVRCRTLVSQDLGARAPPPALPPRSGLLLPQRLLLLLDLHKHKEGARQMQLNTFTRAASQSPAPPPKSPHLLPSQLAHPLANSTKCHADLGPHQLDSLHLFIRPSNPTYTLVSNEQPKSTVAA